MIFNTSANIFAALCIFLFFLRIPQAKSTPENSRRPQLFTIRKRHDTSSKPYIVRIRPASSDSSSRNIPHDMVRESSVLHIKPVIRFHHSEDTVHLAPMNQTDQAADELQETLESMGLSTMAQLLHKSGLDKDLLQVGSVTLFVPTDEAFSLGPRGLLETLLEESDGSDPEREKVKTFLLQHAIRGHLYSEDVRNDLTAKSLHPSGAPLRFNVYDGGQMISVSGSQFLGNARLTGKNRILIQPIDKVLHPAADRNILEKTRFSFPETHSLLIKAGLADQLASGTFTLFAPSDEAFTSLPEKARDLLLKNSTLLRKVMLNHMVPGSYFSTVLTNGYKLKSLAGPLTFTTRRGLILVNGVPIVKPDLPAVNGVIHALNRPLVPDELIDQCRCMPKYNLAPATKKPLQIQAKASGYEDAHAFGTRIKAVPSGYPTFPQQRVAAAEPYDKSPADPDEPSRPTGRESDAPNPPLERLLGIAIDLPDGRKLTFNTADQLFRQTLLINKIRQPGPQGFTILLPTDSAFQHLPPGHLENLRKDPDRLRKILQWHILGENLNQDTLRNNAPVRTIGGGTLLINRLPGGKGFLIGGVPILATRRASNGVIFAVDKVFDPPPANNVFSSPTSSPLQQHPDSDLSIWRRMIDSLPDVRQQLKSRNRVYTMFAPTNAAFHQLTPEQMQLILSDQDLQKGLIYSHVLLGAYYRSMLASGMTLPTLAGNSLVFDIVLRGFLVNDIPVTRAPIVTSNGVIYIIDKLLMFPPPFTSYRSLDAPPVEVPIRQSTLEDIARENEATTFLKWIHASGLRDVIRNQRRCTIFLPTNNAVSSMSPTLRMATISNPKVLKRFISYHVCGGTFIPSRKVLETDNFKLTTLLPGKTIRCNVYNNRTVVTAAGCPVSKVIPIPGESGEEEDGLSVVIVNRTLNPPVGDLPLTASKSPMLRNFTKILKVSDMENEIKHSDPLTIFAPTKCVFAKMPSEEYTKLITDPEAAKDFIRRHIVRGCIFTSGMSNGMKLKTLAGTTLEIETPPDGCVRVNGAKVKYGDIAASNGVLHVVGDSF